MGKDRYLDHGKDRQLQRTYRGGAERAADRNGDTRPGSEKAIVVTSPPDHVVYVYRGPARTTYSCNPDCSARVNLGDDPDVFEKILAETVTRTTQAMAAGQNTTPGR